jgi:hypothetical protein
MSFDEARKMLYPVDRDVFDLQRKVLWTIKNNCLARMDMQL